MARRLPAPALVLPHTGMRVQRRPFLVGTREVLVDGRGTREDVSVSFAADAGVGGGVAKGACVLDHLGQSSQDAYDRALSAAVGLASLATKMVRPAPFRGCAVGASDNECATSPGHLIMPPVASMLFA